MNEPPGQSLPDILDIEPPVEVPPDPIHWAWWVAAVLIVALLVAAAIWWHRRKQPAVESPKERALRRLSILQSQVGRLDGYQFGVSVSDILRTYLTEAHALRASQQTSREFLEALEDDDQFSEKRRQYLRDFLQTCDFLKYAPAGKAEDPNRDLLQQTNFFIREDVA